jgi:RNA polymerase sigma-70 factor (ECF subfamily)
VQSLPKPLPHLSNLSDFVQISETESPTIDLTTMTPTAKIQVQLFQPPLKSTVPIGASRKEIFMNILDPHLTYLRRVARKMTKNPWDADDLVQQTLLKAFVHLDQFRFEASFTSWLTSIAMNELRKIHRRPITALTQAMDMRALEGLAAASHSDSPAVAYERLEDASLLRGALDRLSAPYQMVVRLRDLCELSVQETAQRLSVSTAAAKTRHHRARKKLRLLLNEC